MKDKTIVALMLTSLFLVGIITGMVLSNDTKYYTITNDKESECGFIHVGKAGDEYCFTNIPLEYFE